MAAWLKARQKDACMQSDLYLVGIDKLVVLPWAETDVPLLYMAILPSGQLPLCANFYHNSNKQNRLRLPSPILIPLRHLPRSPPPSSTHRPPCTAKPTQT